MFCNFSLQVSLLMLVEIGLFPLVCGWWLDVCSLVSDVLTLIKTTCTALDYLWMNHVPLPSTQLHPDHCTELVACSITCDGLAFFSGWSGRSYSLLIDANRNLHSVICAGSTDCNSIFTITNVMRSETKNYILGITKLEPSINGSSILHHTDRKSDWASRRLWLTVVMFGLFC